jgi:hypothetical protein
MNLVRRNIPYLLLVALLPLGIPCYSAPQTPWVVFAYNDLGMHCMGQDFSEVVILPPYNNLHAEVIQRGGEPRIIRSGAVVTYTIPSNTHSADKTNFWIYVQQLFGVALAPNIGLTGHGLSGTLAIGPTNDWAATGIPITPIDDTGRENPYCLASVTVTSNSQVMAHTQAVVPVSWEMSCNLCHKTPGISTGTDILRAHDRLHNTTLEQQKPVLCGSCHPDTALATPGNAGVPNLSTSMHGAHATRMAQANLAVPCYACHPGIRTKCLRDVHTTKGMSCVSCHGDMAAVGNSARRPWVDEPKCGSVGCHVRAGFAFEETGKLFKESRGHNGVHCEACHGSPHAITPTTSQIDNAQATWRQGQSGIINQCTVCHIQRPSESFNHTLGG